MIKVKLKFPWKYTDSLYYKTLIESPPKSIEFLGMERKTTGIISNKKKFYFLNSIKEIIRNLFSVLKIPVPNVHYVRHKINGKGAKEFDLIHCAHCLCLNKNVPWVADIESAWQFYVGKETKIGKNFVKKVLLRDNCKKIMPWTEYTAKEIAREFPEIKDKIEVIYPAVPSAIFKKKKNKKPVILFAARYFWIKGGLIALETLRRIKKKHEVEVIFISDAPDDIKKQYPEINFLDLVPHKKMLKYFKESDIFFYPSIRDTFGFALLEAMSFGLPIVTFNTFETKTRREIIDDKKGFIFDVDGEIDYYNINKKEQEIVKKFEGLIEKLVKNRKLREKMSKNCLNEIKTGKFSIKNRNEKLTKIYKETANGL